MTQTYECWNKNRKRLEAHQKKIAFSIHGPLGLLQIHFQPLKNLPSASFLFSYVLLSNIYFLDDNCHSNKVLNPKRVTEEGFLNSLYSVRCSHSRLTGLPVCRKSVSFKAPSTHVRRSSRSTAAHYKQIQVVRSRSITPHKYSL